MSVEGEVDAEGDRERHPSHRRQRRLTLAPRPLSAEVDRSCDGEDDIFFNDSEDSTGDAEQDSDAVKITTIPATYGECMESALLAGLTVLQAHGDAEDVQSNYNEILHQARLAGYSSGEATNFATEKLQSVNRIKKSDVELCEDFWNQIGFPKGTGWWENHEFVKQSAESSDVSPNSDDHMVMPAGARIHHVLSLSRNRNRIPGDGNCIIVDVSSAHGRDLCRDQDERRLPLRRSCHRR